MKEYIIHGVYTDNLIGILEDGYIAINNKKKKVAQKMIDKEINQIFTQLIYRNIPYEETQKPHWYNYVIVLDKKILKDYPFYACNIGDFYDAFNDAFLDEDNKVFVKSKGKLKRMPNLTKLKKNCIEKYIKDSDVYRFIHSHEIMFNKNIPLKKYCLCIVVDGELEKIPQEIFDLAQKLEIPLKNQSFKKENPFSVMGINDLIDIIEK
jgi:hypothetical protein